MTQNLPVLAVQNLNASRVNNGLDVLIWRPARSCRTLFGLSAPPIGRRAEHLAHRRTDASSCQRVFARALAGETDASDGGAYNVTVQYQLPTPPRSRPPTLPTKFAHVAGDGPGININHRPGEFAAPTERASPLLPTVRCADIDFFCNCADNRYIRCSEIHPTLSTTATRSAPITLSRGHCKTTATSSFIIEN